MDGCITTQHTLLFLNTFCTKAVLSETLPIAQVINQWDKDELSWVGRKKRKEKQNKHAVVL